MAETEQVKEAEVAPHAVLSPEEASSLQREIILNARNPDYVMPDGRTNAQIWEAQAAQDEEDRKGADEFERRSLEVNTPRVAAVALRVEPAGNVVAVPQAVESASTQTAPAAQGGESGASSAGGPPPGD